MLSSHLILCHPLLLPSVFASIRVFSSESVLHIMWSEYWSFSFSISPFSEYSVLISFRNDWSDLLGVQRTQAFCSTTVQKHQFFCCSAFFIVQFSHTYCWIALTIQTFVKKVMSLLFYTLSRFVIAFLPRTKCLLILWLQSPSLVILEQRK